VLRLCGRRQRRLSSCARAGASRGGTLFFGVKTWRQEEVQQKARRCCAEDDRQEAPTLIVGFDFFWALPICRRKAVPLIIPVHTLSRQNLLHEKNLCSFLVVPLLTRHFEKRCDVWCLARTDQVDPSVRFLKVSKITDSWLAIHEPGGFC
jgi:hypothetical protein